MLLDLYPPPRPREVSLHVPHDLPDHYDDADDEPWPTWAVFTMALLLGIAIGAVGILPLLAFLARWGWVS